MQPGHRVLDVGCGCGVVSAICAFLVSQRLLPRRIPAELPSFPPSLQSSSGATATRPGAPSPGTRHCLPETPRLTGISFSARLGRAVPSWASTCLRTRSVSPRPTSGSWCRPARGAPPPPGPHHMRCLAGHLSQAATFVLGGSSRCPSLRCWESEASVSSLPLSVPADMATPPFPQFRDGGRRLQLRAAQRVPAAHAPGPLRPHIRRGAVPRGEPAGAHRAASSRGRRRRRARGQRTAPSEQARPLRVLAQLSPHRMSILPSVPRTLRVLRFSSGQTASARVSALGC